MIQCFSAFKVKNFDPVTIKILIAFVLSMSVIAPLSAQTDWVIEKDQNGIVVETRVTDLTPIKEFRAKTTVKAPIETVVDALVTVEKHPDWMVDINHAERLNEDPEILHYNIDTPFPMKDRYIVVQVTTTHSDGSYRLEMESTEATPNKIDDHVHIPIVRGSWQFDQINDSTTAVQYQFLSDPGLKMPDWLVNMFIVNNPYKTLKNLKKLVE